MDQSSAVYAALGQQLRNARHRAGLTQEVVAHRVSLTRTSINNIEHGRQKILLHTLYDLAAALGTTPAALLPSLAPKADHINEDLPPGLAPNEREWVQTVLAVEPED